MNPHDIVLWAHHSLRTLLLDLHRGGVQPATEVAALAGVPTDVLPFAAMGLVPWDPRSAATAEQWCTFFSATGDRAAWLIGLRHGQPPTAGRPHCIRTVGDRPVTDPAALAVVEALDRGVAAAVPALVATGLDTVQAGRGLAILTLSGWVVERADGLRVLTDQLHAPEAGAPVVPPPWRMGLAREGWSDALADTPLRPGDTLNVEVEHHPGREGWVVVLLDHTGDDWTVRFPVEPLHCISWSHLRVDAAGRRTLGINIDARTGRRRWAVGLVPRALLDQTVFNANPAGLRAAMNENFVEFQMVRAEVEPPPEL